MAKARSVVRKARGRCTSPDSPVIVNPNAYWHGLDAKLPFGAVKAMMEAQAQIDHIEHYYARNGTCQICHTVKSGTGACWC